MSHIKLTMSRRAFLVVDLSNAVIYSLSNLTCPINATVTSAFSTVTLAFNSDVGYLPKHENEFIHKIFEDLEILLQGDAHNSVLIFPSLPTRLCDLIQKTVENYPSLCTFSVGEGRNRRMVVCHSHLRISSEDGSDKGNRTYEQPLELEKGMQCWTAKCSPRSRTKQMSKRGNREPDKPTFLPRALWEMDSASCSSYFSEESCSDTTEESLTANQDELSDSSDHMTHDALMSLSSPGLGLWPPSWDQPISYFRAASWDCASGDACSKTDLPALEPQINGDYISEITAKFKEQDVVILRAQNDYSFYEDTQVDMEAFGHILELYNISPMFKTQDLMDAFPNFSGKGLKIHWVDHTRALAVFSCKSAALQALTLQHPLIRVRSLARGSKKSRGKALRLAELLRPMTEDQQTDPSFQNAGHHAQHLRASHR